MKASCKTLIFLLFLNFILSAQAFAAWFGSGLSPKSTESAESRTTPFISISEMADAMARELKEEHAGMGLKLYLDRDEIREDLDARSVPFTGMLANELERAFSRVGFNFEEGLVYNQSDYSVNVSYQRTEEKVTVYLKLKKTKDGSYRNLKGSYELPLNKLPGDCFTESLDNKLARLFRKVSQGLNGSRTRSLFVVPMVEAMRKYSSPFSEYVTSRLKANLAELPSFRLVEGMPAVKKGTKRSIESSADLDGAAALLSGADAVLEGFYLRGPDKLSLSLTIKDLKGKVLASVQEEIPIGLVPFSLENDDAEILSRIADTEHENSGVVRISTVKGGSYQIFKEGEMVRFTFQVSRPLYVYVYDINPDGGVNLLYPKEGEPEQQKQPGVIHYLPEEYEAWEIKVAAPFGKDAVKLFASDQRLTIPLISTVTASRNFPNGPTGARNDRMQKELASQPIINGLDIVDYYKGVATRNGAALYESTAYVETKAK